MSLKLKLFMICICIIFMLFIYKKVEKGNLQLKYSLSWYAIAIGLIFVSIFDSILVPIRDFLGFETISNMVFLLGFMLLAMLVFTLNVKISELTAKNTKLTQELALLKKESTKNGKNKKTDK